MCKPKERRGKGFGIVTIAIIHIGTTRTGITATRRRREPKFRATGRTSSAFKSVLNTVIGSSLLGQRAVIWSESCGGAHVQTLGAPTGTAP